MTTLYTFCSLTNCADGAYPTSGLTPAKDGNFYGVTNDGGTENYGTFFKITPEGKLTTLYSFCSQANCADGTYPTAGLLQAANGNFYRATRETLEGAWVRPRHDGYMAFQQAGAERINAGIRAGDRPEAVVADLNRLFADSFV